MVSSLISWIAPDKLINYMNLHFLQHKLIMRISWDIGKPHTVHGVYKVFIKYYFSYFPATIYITYVLYLCYTIILNFIIQSLQNLWKCVLPYTVQHIFFHNTLNWNVLFRAIINQDIFGAGFPEQHIVTLKTQLYPLSF